MGDELPSPWMPNPTRSVEHGRSLRRSTITPRPNPHHVHTHTASAFAIRIRTLLTAASQVASPPSRLPAHPPPSIRHVAHPSLPSVACIGCRRLALDCSARAASRPVNH
ncbi:hypothetical protein Cob_v006430 [Colletotrichum orbiculare MAFF 240422]|uniref:Uncharacterized protein n=1 Tax=Colletotrichum orbiculare (strain 104-T / ATCC 96160 / CBS 514.97 / LARS 414 / MAFF 240422) TaxID=1213857 RepID=A0A484FRA4_COLOR|nr:hypothetical protein Cob_v006430 [Colletotrichum orbiculare MAFF 240422]